MTTTSQFLVRETSSIPHEVDGWRWLLVSGAAIGSFGALVAGNASAALVLLAVVILVIALDRP